MKDLSKYLSYVLRHAPDSIGLTLDAQGYASVAELIEKSVAAGRKLDAGLLREIVASSPKQRFTLSPDGTRIRAAQGHSIDVDPGLAPVTPPNVLYHGTAKRFLPSIREKGLIPGERRQVHLSGDAATARSVGMRHGSPVVLTVAAQRMHDDGHAFFVADNGVWLTDHVPTQYLDA